jgi:hypothetical protein
MKHKIITILLVISFPVFLWDAIEEKAFYSYWFYIGLVVAIFAHAKKSWINITLLFLHMCIEWYALAKNLVFSGVILIHIIPEIFFFTHEVKAHVKKYYYPTIFILFLSLISIFFYSKREEAQKPKTFGQMYIKEHAKNHNHDSDNIFLLTLSFLSLGGLVGCSGSHIPYHLFKEKPDKN